MKKDNISELITLWVYSSDAFLILDSNAQILYANPVLEQVSGLDVKKQEGRNIRDLLEDGTINNSASLKAIQQKRIVTSKLVTAAGKHLLSTASPVLDKKGNLHRVVCNIRSLSLVQNEGLPENNVPAGRQKNAEGRANVMETEDRGPELVYLSRQMDHVVKMAYRLAAFDSTVLITGETGVGKELVARLIHNNSLRGRLGSMVKINCAAIPKDLIESELFGYDPGSFTGALRFGKPGYMELANDGTLFLDEIAELPLEAQAKLLGILQDREYYKVGSTKPSLANVRIIAATNRNLEEMVASGTFRKDLYYRLHVIPVEVPSLRERREDIPVLVSHFCRKMELKCGIKKEIASAVIERLYNYDWPGNVRELESLIERLLITVPHNPVTPAHLPTPYAVQRSGSAATLKEKLEQFELELIRAELEHTRDKYEAAEKLGISISSLFRKIKLLDN